jgi:Fic family protein
LLLGDRVPVNRDEKEVKNYFALLKDLKNYDQGQISIKTILDIHKKLLTGVKDRIAGKIRDKKVVVGKYIGEDQESLSLEVKHEPPFHSRKQIEKSLEELSVWAKNDSQTPAVLKAGVYHHHFVYIHPFVDGNGRVCRLLTALIFLQDNYLINKYFVLDDYYDIDRLQYSDMLHTADSGDKTEWLEYFSDGVKYSLQGALARVEEAMLNLKVEERPSKKEAQVLEIIKERREVTSADITKSLKISRQQAHRLLKALVDKGFLNKKGKTKRSYYSLK